MDNVKCRKSECGSHNCNVAYKNISFDVCLGKELFWLWDQGIETIGCCCGKHLNHKATSYIQVKNKFINKMKELGYKEDKNYKFKPCNSFIPRTFEEKLNNVENGLEEEIFNYFMGNYMLLDNQERSLRDNIPRILDYLINYGYLTTTKNNKCKKQ